MKFKVVEFENFKGLKNKTFHFNSRVIVIAGDNGKSKSTLLEGLTYLLTEYLAEKNSEYMTWDGSEHFKIKGIFDHKDKEYSEMVKVSKNKTEKLLQVSGEEDYRNSDVSKRLAEIADPKLTLFSSISTQHESTSLLFETPAKKLDKFKQILGIDLLPKAGELLREDAKIIEDEIKLLKNKISVLQELTFEKQEVIEVPDISGLKDELLKLREEQDEIKAKLDLKKTELNEAEKELLRIERLWSDYENHNLKLEKAETDIIKLEEEKKGYTVVRIKKPDCTEDDVVTARDQLSDVAATLKVLIGQIKLAEAGKCPTCEQDYSTDPEELKKQQVESIKVKEDIQKTIEAFQTELLDYNKKSEKNKLNKKYADQLDSKIFTLREFIDKTESVPEPKTTTSDVESNIVEIKKELQSCDVSQESINRINFLQKEIHQNESLVEEAARILKFNEDVDVKKKENEDGIKTIAEEVNVKEFRVKLLKDSRTNLEKDFSSFLIEEGSVLLQKKMDDFFARTYGRFTIHIKKDSKSIDFFYSPGEGVMKPVAMAGGFEKQLMAMSFRVALMSFQDLGWLCLDEVDSSSSASNSINFYSNLLKYPFEQLFLISHNPDTIDYLQREHNAQVIEL